MIKHNIYLIFWNISESVNTYINEYDDQSWALLLLN